MLTTEQRAVLTAELQQLVYDGKDVAQAQQFLTSLSSTRLSSGAIKSLGFATTLGQIATLYCVQCLQTCEAPRQQCECGGVLREMGRSPKALSMPNAFDPQEFAEVFSEARPS